LQEDSEHHSEYSPPQPGVESVGLRRTIILLLFAFAFYPTVVSFPGARTVESQTSRRLEFMLRRALDMEPPVDPLLKIVVWDEKTVSYLNKSKKYAKDLPIAQWGDVVKSIAAQGPSAILFNRDFALPYQPEGAGSLAETASKIGPAVFLGALVWQEKLSGRELLPKSRGIDSKLGAKIFAEKSGEKVFVHGPAPSLSATRAIRFGHLSIAGDAFFYPWYPLEGSRILPHFALRAFSPETNDFKVLPNGFQINRKKVEVDSRGRVLIDIPSLSRLSHSANTISVSQVLQAMEHGKPIEAIRSGDYVVILPNIFVGGRDVRSTYAGDIDAGMLNVAILNNVLTGTWFKYFEGGWWFGMLFIAIAAAMGLYLPPAAFASVFTSLLLLFIAGSVGSAVYFNLVISWLYPAIFYGVTGIAVFMEAHRLSMVRNERLRSSLGGVLAPKQVQELIKRGASVRPEPSEQNVSIVFVDIVGFSKIAEEARPKEVFAQLRALMIKMRSLVHEYGGVVDRSLGDGMVAFFGYNYTGAVQSENHAEKALMCAREMQIFSAKSTVEAQKKGASNVFPLRIGINTGLVFIGDLGDENRVDFTLIGHGVNMAQRLEAACETFGVMVGPQTREAVKGNEKLLATLERRVMQAKHHDELLDAYELDSFAGQRQLLRMAMESYRSMHNLQRQAERHTSGNGVIKVAIKVSSDHGMGELVDFSMGGFSIKLDTFLARGVITQLTLDSTDGQLGENCREFGLFPVPVEVRWGVKVQGGYLHGVETKGLNDIQRGLLHRELRGYTGGQGSSRRWSVPDGMPLRLVSDKGEGRIVNFSQNGVGLMLAEPNLKVDDRIEIDFAASPSPLCEVAASAGIKKVAAIVRRSGTKEQPGYYGVEISGLDEEARANLFKGLQGLVRPTKVAS